MWSSCFEEHSLLSPGQFGFKGVKDTEDQLLLMYGGVIELVDSGRVMDMFFSNAVDRVTHAVIITKLRLLGVSDRLLSSIWQFLSGTTLWVLRVPWRVWPVVFHRAPFCAYYSVLYM